MIGKKGSKRREQSLLLRGERLPTHYEDLKEGEMENETE